MASQESAHRSYHPSQTQASHQQPHHFPHVQSDFGSAHSHQQFAHSQQVDSWRSYRNDQLTGNTLHSLHNPRQGFSTQPQYPRHHAMPQQGYLNARAPEFQPSRPLHLASAAQTESSSYEPLRARMDWSHGQHGIESVHRGLQGGPSLVTVTPTSSRYSFRARRTDQIAPYSTGAVQSSDSPIPSIEAGPDTGSSSTAMGQASDFPRRPRQSRSSTPANRDVKPPTPPKATKVYMRQAALTPERRGRPKKLLVILDLNGTILVRTRLKTDPKKATMRPGVHALLEYLFQNHVVMVYSSARPENTEGMVNSFMHPKQRKQLAAIWARDKLDLNHAQYNSKVQVYKKLDKIWRDPAIQARAEPNCKWDQTNTILVDDTYLKALAQPHNLLRVPEFLNNAPRRQGAELNDWMAREKAILKSLEERLEELKWQVDVSRLIREWQAGTTSAPGAIDEQMDEEAQDTIRRQVEPSPAPSVDQGAAFQSYLSPKSPVLQGVEELDEPAEPLIPKQRGGKRNGTMRSVSPVDASVFRELLGMDEKEGDNGDRKTDGPATPESLDEAKRSW